MYIERSIHIGGSGASLTNKEHCGSKRKNIADGVADGKRGRVSTNQLAKLKEAHYGNEQSDTCNNSFGEAQSCASTRCCTCRDAESNHALSPRERGAHFVDFFFDFVAGGFLHAGHQANKVHLCDEISRCNCR